LFPAIWQMDSPLAIRPVFSGSGYHVEKNFPPVMRGLKHRLEGGGGGGARRVKKREKTTTTELKV